MAQESKRGKGEKTKKQKDAQFQPGNDASKGGTHSYNAEERLARKLDASLLFRILNLNINRTVAELIIEADDENKSVFERIVAKSLVAAVEAGDLNKLDYFITRLVGKIPDRLLVGEDNPYKDLSIEQIKAELDKIRADNQASLDHVLKNKTKTEDVKKYESEQRTAKSGSDKTDPA